MNRCKIHNRFIPKTGCPICKQIEDLQNEIKVLQNKQLPNNVIDAISYLSRNEKQTILNIYGAQSMLVAVVDHINKMPETLRKASIKPLFDYIIDTGSILDNLCDLMAVKMSSEIGTNRFNDLIADCSTVVDILSGVKMRSCLTCLKYLDKKAENKIAIRNHIGWKISIKGNQ